MLRWVKARFLRSFQTGGGQQRILPGDLRVFMASRGMPIPTELLQGAVRIAIVDDMEPVRRALRQSVAALIPGAVIFEAADGFEAGVLIGAHRPHVVLLDLVMPGLNGVEVCRRLRADESLAEVQVVGVTGRRDPALRAELMSLGVHRILDKPVSSGMLAETFGELGLLATAPQER